MLVITIPLAIETLVNLKYLMENGEENLLDSYVNVPAKKRSSAGIVWDDLDLKIKAEATGFSDVYANTLKDAPLYLHGSWRDLVEYHLTPVDEERYLTKLKSDEPNPRPLITLSIHSTFLIYAFSSIILGGPVKENLQKGLHDLYGRLMVAGEEFDKFLYERWS